MINAVIPCKWLTRRNIPTIRVESTSITCNGTKVYTIGGMPTTGGKVVNVNEMLDDKANTWTTKTPIITSRKNLWSACTGTNIYAMGGATDSSISNLNEKYDTLTDTWSTVTKLPSTKINSAVCNVDGKIYVLGGATNFGTANSTDTISIYDSETDTWTSLSQKLVSKKSNITADVIKGIIYMTGGIPANNTTITFDTVLKVCTTKAPFPKPTISYHSTYTMYDKLYVVAGQVSIPSKAYELYDICYQYDPSQNKWIAKDTNFTHRYLQSSAKVDDGIIIISGLDTVTNNETNSVQKLVVETPVIVPEDKATFDYTGPTHFRLKVGEVSPLKDIKAYLADGTEVPVKREGNNGGSSVGTSNVRYTLPNGDYMILSYERYEYRAGDSISYKEGEKWEAKNPMGSARSSFGIANSGSKAYLVGGLSGSSTMLSSNVEYDYKTDSYVIKTNMPTARQLLTATYCNNKIYAVNGINGSSIKYENEEFDITTNTWAKKRNATYGVHRHASVMYNGKIYITGGSTSGVTGRVGYNTCYDATTDTWTTKAAVNYGGPEVSSVVLSSIMYVVGLYDAASGDNKITAYYTDSSNTWTYKSKMPSHARTKNAVISMSEIAVIGGKNVADEPHGTLQYYNISSDTWKAKREMLYSRKECGSTVLNNEIHTFGGYDISNVNTKTTTHQMYTPEQTKSIKIPDYDIKFNYKGSKILKFTKLEDVTIPNIVSASGMNTTLTVDRKIYDINDTLVENITKEGLYTVRYTASELDGKANNLDILISVELEKEGNIPDDNIQTEVEENWGKIRDLVQEKSRSVIAACNGNLYSALGEGIKGNDKYDLSTKTWVSRANTSVSGINSIISPTAQSYGDNIHYIGGGTYNKVFNDTDNVWSNKTNAPHEMTDHVSSAKLYNFIHIMGANNTITANRHVRYDTILDVWDVKKESTHKNTGIGMTTHNNKIYAMGGSSTGYMDCFDDLTNTWTTKSNMLEGRNRVKAECYKDKIYVIGGAKYVNGSTSSNSGLINEEYDILTDTWYTKLGLTDNCNYPSTCIIKDKIYVVGLDAKKSTIMTYEPNHTIISSSQNNTIRFDYEGDILLTFDKVEEVKIPDIKGVNNNNDILETTRIIYKDKIEVESITEKGIYEIDYTVSEGDLTNKMSIVIIVGSPNSGDLPSVDDLQEILQDIEKLKQLVILTL